LHGHLPDVPECDLLVVAGDVCPDGHVLEQAKWLDGAFRAWLDAVPAPHVVGVGGNHDLIFERAEHLVPSGLRWSYLQDSAVELAGLSIYGIPWVLPVWGAFNIDEESLAKKLKHVEGMDVLVTHGPPFGVRDEAPCRFEEGVENCGSLSLMDLVASAEPSLVVFGHIHEGYGQTEANGIRLVNAAHCNSRGIPLNAPILVDVERR
jgi:Icc-related predicted phosphoesterase